MKKTVKQLISQSFYRLLGSVIRLALRNGITHKEFSAIGKQLFVHIAAEEYGLRGRTTNMARIALMTGLERKDIKRVMEQKVMEGAIEAAPDRMSRILSVWYKNEAYIDDNGKPLVIPIEGPAPSFHHLIKTYGGDVAIVTVLREFKRSQTIVENQTGMLEVKTRYYVPNYHNTSEKAPELVNPKAIAQGSSMLIDHINTIFYNLYRDDMNTRKKLDLRATNVAVRKDAVDDFYQLVHEKGIAFLEDIDQWLSQHEINDPSQESERLGLGMYFIEGPNESIPPTSQKRDVEK